MTGRIYIRDFSYEATAEDLGLLISKVCPVEEVYISGQTPTGINRSFAIVVVKANDALIEKCIKTFNNCHWRGTKIWVEKAKEYYKDRFERERARERKLEIKKLHSGEIADEDHDLDKLEELLTEEIKAADAELTTGLDPNSEKIAEGKVIADSSKTTSKAVAIVKHVIRIKKCRDGPPIAISMVPSLSSSTSEKKSKKILPCGKRTTFDIDDCGTILYTPIQVEDASTSGDDESDDSDDEDSIDKKESAIKASKQNKDKTVVDKNSEVSKHNKNARAVATGSKPTPPTEVLKAQGGGARKGFGGLSTVAVSALPVPLSQAYLKKLVPTPQSVDCCIETDRESRHIGQPSKVFGLDTDDLRNDSAQESIEFAGDDDNRNPYRVDDVPCVDSAELTDEVLQSERQRSLDMFASIMKSAGSSSVEAPASAPPGVVSIPKKKAKSVVNKEVDDTAETPKSSALEGNKRVVDAWESVKPLRFDPSKKSSVSVQLSAEEAMRRNSAAQAAALVERQQQREKDEAAVAQAKEDATAAEGAKKIDNFANLDSLKNIFYQEGGVWWGDDGTLNDAVSKGNVAEDALFREAEKLGIDIRKKRTDETQSKQEPSQGLSAALGSNDPTKMTFGFFDEYFATDPAAAGAVASGQIAQQHSGTVREAPVQLSSSSLAVAGYDTKHTPVARNVDPQSLIPPRSLGGDAPSDVVLEEPEVIAVVMSLQEVVANARRFCRERKESELFSDWRESRDKLVVDYKRKSKDAKKRVLDTAGRAAHGLKDGQMRSSAPEVTHEKASTLGKRGRDKGPEHGARGGKKGRGSRGVIRKIFVK